MERHGRQATIEVQVTLFEHEPATEPFDAEPVRVMVKRVVHLTHFSPERGSIDEVRRVMEEIEDLTHTDLVRAADRATKGDVARRAEAAERVGIPGRVDPLPPSRDSVEDGA
jgi:hypothetical protein